MAMPADMLFESPFAAAFGAAGLFCQLAWPIFKARQHMLVAQLGAAAGYAAQYAALEQWSGTSVCTIGAAQTLITVLFDNRPWLRYLGFGFIPLVVLLSYWTWNGVASALALTACCLVMVGRMQRDTLRMRAIILAASPLGIGYDVLVGALPALAGAILSCTIGIIAFRREWLARQREAAKPSEPPFVQNFRYAIP